MFKSSELTRSNIQRIVGCARNDYLGQKAIVPVSKRGRSNAIVATGSGEYDGGDRVIGFPNGYEIDGDLIFTSGWGDGFAVRRLNNDGTLTKLFHDNNFLYRDTGNQYNHMQSVAIDRVNKKGVVMTYNVDGYTTFDYSGLMNGGTTFVKDPRPTHSNPQRFIGGASGAVNLSSVGLYYTSGMVAAGEWIYAGEYDARHYQKYPRRNLRTGEEQLLTWETNGKTGTANDDRNGYRHTLFYDDVNDRVFFCAYYNANFMMVERASTANPELVWCDMGDAGVGDDSYEMALHIEDPVGAPNIITIGASGRHCKIDITPCQTGTRPTILEQVYENASGGQAYNVLMRAGTKYQSTTAGQPTDRMVGYPHYIPVSPDRGRAMASHGWLDWDNNKYVSLYRPNNVTEDTSSHGRGQTYYSDYGCPVVRVYSANGTPYWVQMGYGYHGHSFYVWSNDYANHLIPNWELEYGVYQLDNNANIDFVYWNKIGYYTPSGCTLQFFVSNNNGSTWEAYNGTDDTQHTFSSTGNRLRCKLVGNGDVSKNAYRMSDQDDLVLYGTMYAAEKDPSIKAKFARTKIRGRK